MKLKISLKDIYGFDVKHRGCYNSKIPENSLAAFKMCLDKGKAIEIDVHILKDDSLIVFHDDNFFRLTGHNKKVRNMSYDEIKFYRLENTNEKIPLLTEVLSLIAGKVPIIIELKFDHKDYRLEKEIIKILESYEGEIYIQTFSYKSAKFMEKSAKYPVVFLFKPFKNIKKKFSSGKL